MNDGAPNGYSVMTFDGKKYDWEFVAARRPADYQMQIHAPDVVLSDDSSTEVLVNVFGGSERSMVEMRIDSDGEWIALEKVMREDPYFARLKTLEEVTTGVPMAVRGLKLPAAIESPHMWRGMLPSMMKTGTRMICVRTTDMFGKTYESKRLIRVE